MSLASPGTPIGIGLADPLLGWIAIRIGLAVALMIIRRPEPGAALAGATRTA